MALLFVTIVSNAYFQIIKNIKTLNSVTYRTVYKFVTCCMKCAKVLMSSQVLQNTDIISTKKSLEVAFIPLISEINLMIYVRGGDPLYINASFFLNKYLMRPQGRNVNNFDFVIILKIMHANQVSFKKS